MTTTAKPTLSRLRDPLVSQFSVLLINKVGALFKLTRTLTDRSISICGLSVVDTSDASLVRLIVDDPDACREVLGSSKHAFTEAQLVVVELPLGMHGLDKVWQPLAQAEVNLKYTYSLLIRPKNKALLALHCDDPEYARNALVNAGFTVVGQQDISR
jgi:hypothetical protein